MFGLTPFDRKDFFNAFNDFDREFFGDRMGRMMPPPPPEHEFRTDIKETENSYILKAELPGFEKEDIAIDISKDYLTISATHKENKEEKSEDGKFIRREIYSGKYSRSFSVAGIDSDNISAEYNNGVLKIDLPKLTEEKEKRRLEIK